MFRKKFEPSLKWTPSGQDSVAQYWLEDGLIESAPFWIVYENTSEDRAMLEGQFENYYDAVEHAKSRHLPYILFKTMCADPENPLESTYNKISEFMKRSYQADLLSLFTPAGKKVRRQLFIGNRENGVLLWNLFYNEPNGSFIGQGPFTDDKECRKSARDRKMPYIILLVDIDVATEIADIMGMVDDMFQGKQKVAVG